MFSVCKELQISGAQPPALRHMPLLAQAAPFYGRFISCCKCRSCVRHAK